MATPKKPPPKRATCKCGKVPPHAKPDSSLPEDHLGDSPEVKPSDTAWECHRVHAALMVMGRQMDDLADKIPDAGVNTRLFVRRAVADMASACGFLEAAAGFARLTAASKAGAK